MPQLFITKRRLGSVLVLDLEGDILTGSGLDKAVSEILDAGSKKLLLNLAGVAQLDSSGLDELIGTHSKVTRFGGELKLVNIAPRIRGVLDLAPLSTDLEMFNSMADALRSFANASVAHSLSRAS